MELTFFSRVSVGKGLSPPNPRFTAELSRAEYFLLISGSGPSPTRHTLSRHVYRPRTIVLHASTVVVQVPTRAPTLGVTRDSPHAAPFRGTRPRTPIDSRSSTATVRTVSKLPTKLPHLGELEVAVLEYLWTADDADVAETHAKVGKKRGITTNTVGSALERLFKKGLTRRQKVSHAFRYSAALGQAEFSARRVAEAAGGLRGLTNAGMLSAFVDLVADVDEAALERLEMLVAEKRQRDGDR